MTANIKQRRRHIAMMAGALVLCAILSVVVQSRPPRDNTTVLIRATVDTQRCGWVKPIKVTVTNSGHHYVKDATWSLNAANGHHDNQYYTTKYLEVGKPIDTCVKAPNDVNWAASKDLSATVLWTSEK